ncbi:tetratricopeptide repeat protein [Tundrisphaera lichenicola]|uniref:tetratricopeptide repeat protein n=1 Tax=Tundrisphaera lichenicola TaxID=2029860 RepID=UPI003EB6BC08
MSIAFGVLATWWYVRGGPSTGEIARAEHALEVGDLTGARSILARVLEERPREPRARLLYARLLRLSGRAREADVALGRAMELGVPEADLWREYGLLIAGSDFGKAEPILLRALGRSPHDPEILAALTDGTARQDHWVDSVDFANRWLKAEPDRVEARIARARALVRTARPGEAAADLRIAAGRRPRDYQIRLFLADCLMGTNNPAGASAEFEEARQLRPDLAEPLVGLARCDLELGEPDRARSSLDRAIELDPSSRIALTTRGSLAVKRQQDELAKADFERVVALDPNHREAHFQLAQIYRRLGEHRRAEEHERAFRELSGAPSGVPEAGPNVGRE